MKKNVMTIQVDYNDSRVELTPQLLKLSKKFKWVKATILTTKIRLS